MGPGPGYKEGSKVKLVLLGTLAVKICKGYISH